MRSTGTERIKFLLSPDSPSYSPRYFNISDFGLPTKEPGGGLCAAFEDWAIWAWLPTHPNHMTKLYAYPSPEPQPKAHVSPKWWPFSMIRSNSGILNLLLRARRAAMRQATGQAMPAYDRFRGTKRYGMAAMDRPTPP